MKSRIKVLYSMIFIFILTFSCKYDKEDLIVCDASDVRFSTVINPIIQSNCAIPGCHDGSIYAGDYRTYLGLKVRVDDGTFRARVVTIHAMPPVNKLSDCDYKRLQLWLDAGAQDN
ncbi:MAG TPA: hypothetical protein VFJ43_00105 [Bacteroidia bacterium]|nr:hypothetical protein [Bacteroidia bacterium]